MIDLFLVLFLTSGRSHSSIAALVPPQHSIGQSMSKFSSFPVCLAASFFSLRSCDDQLLLTICGLRNQIVVGTLLVLACHLSTHSAGVSYSLVPSSWLQLCTIHLQASSKRQLRNSTGNRITDRVVVTRIHAQCKHTHTLERTASPNTNRFPKVCSTTEQSR